MEARRAVFSKAISITEDATSRGYFLARAFLTPLRDMPVIDHWILVQYARNGYTYPEQQAKYINAALEIEQRFWERVCPVLATKLNGGEVLCRIRKKKKRLPML